MPNEIDLSAISELEESLNLKFNKNTETSKSFVGEYLGVDEEGQAWVKISGNDFATPLTNQGVTAEFGDAITVSVENGYAMGDGNLSSPLVTEKTTEVKLDPLRSSILDNREYTQHVETLAGEVKAIAEATGQHFWTDTDGTHITDVSKKDWLEAEADGFPSSDPNPYHNSLWNSLGMLFRAGLNKLVSISRSAIAFYDKKENPQPGEDEDRMVASFGKDGVFFNSDIPQRIGGESAYVRYYDSNEDGLADAIEIVADSITFLGTPLETTISEIDEDISNAARTATDFLAFNDGALVIGISSSEIKSVLTNQKFAFATNAGDIAYFGYDSGIWNMYIANAEITDMLKFGDFAWIRRSNGNLTLKWIGED